ncbi:MAG: Heimdall-CTERM domain-containing surface protein [Candidatus Hodarchaeales archaeon]
MTTSPGFDFLVIITFFALALIYRKRRYRT